MLGRFQLSELRGHPRPLMVEAQGTPVRPSIRPTPGFTCRARLNDWPPTNEVGHTSAPCLVQALVVRPGHWTSAPAIHCSRLGTGAMNLMSRMET